MLAWKVKLYTEKENKGLSTNCYCFCSSVKDDTNKPVRTKAKQNYQSWSIGLIAARAHTLPMLKTISDLEDTFKTLQWLKKD